MSSTATHSAPSCRLPLVHPHDHSLCPVYDSIQLLQEKWVLHIVRALLEGPHGFNELGAPSAA
jgi:DNA-binding HxlR family transcriptional regulator